ncbi:MerR family transcriptional regulator, partial [uncultured Corynebacterium sp.]|uniref:MerR family transcriptional regulator n=1 Tax=uncultured Corynebacterium sp. TaxID=159447 RepID=UPI0026097C0B
MSIGTVLAELQQEFPDVTVSKIRFLESEGLISPSRSASGYRRFARADVGVEANGASRWIQIGPLT